MTAERTLEKAKQVFDVRHWIESELREMEPKIAAAELVDNALEETSEEATCEVNVVLDKGGRRIIFENRNTSGMGTAEMQSYPVWGGVHKDTTFIKEHRLGGKLAVLFFISSRDGAVKIGSMPAGSKTAFGMNIGNWWERLSTSEEFPIKRSEMKDQEKFGWTRIEMSGVEPAHTPDARALGDYLGFTFGKLIEKDRLKINLVNLARGGRKKEAIPVIPLSIPFSHDLHKTEEDVPVGKEQVPRVSLSWGLIDLEKKEKQESARKAIYGASATQIHGERVYYFYHGRLIKVEPLSSLNIPGYRRKHSLDWFVVSVDVSKGYIPKTILKTALAPSDRLTQGVQKKIAYFVSPTIKDLVKESTSRLEISTPHKRKAKLASEFLAAALNKLYQNNIFLIAETFSLPFTQTTSVEEDKSEREVLAQKTKKKREPIHHLPGMRGRGETILQKEVSIRRPGWVNPIPEIIPTHFSADFPEAELAIDESGKPVIQVNFSNPFVNAAFRERSRDITNLMLLRVAASVLYQQKNLKQFPEESLKYEKSMQDDIAKFLSVVEGLRIQKVIGVD